MYDWAPIKAISSIFWFLLQWIHNFIPSYGWSIILLTIIFRAALLPLDLKQKISMKRMSLVQPKIAALNEKYKNDKEKAAQATMALYKEEKVSPFSGCLPSLLQMFLFFAFYGALQNVANTQLHNMFDTMQKLVETYGANAIPANLLPKVEGWLWIHNVWQPDTAMFSSAPQAGALTFMGMDSHIIPPFTSLRQFKDFRTIAEATYTSVMKPLMDANSKNWNGWFVMPILAGISSYFQMKITMPPQPANPDPKAAQSNPFNSKMFMYLMPLMSVYFSAVSNSIFALYWFTSNVCVTITYKAFDIYWNAKMKKEEAEKQVRLEQQQKEEAERIAAAAALKAARAEAKTKAKEGKK